ncbi:MAG: response regulator [Candidatus Wildermuthbacteria bacterium]|nr:response regulator [Candidatus Wildermuthbacteria bacterium]
MKKILLVEDEKILAEMYQSKLTKAGFKVFLVSEAKEGLALAKKEKPDLILLDILLPMENGISFLTELRKDSAIASTPVVAFSNYDDPGTKKQALDLGAKGYLIKTNYTPSEIIEKIKMYLNAENS